MVITEGKRTPCGLLWAATSSTDTVMPGFTLLILVLFVLLIFEQQAFSRFESRLTELSSLLTQRS